MSFSQPEAAEPTAEERLISNAKPLRQQEDAALLGAKQTASLGLVPSARVRVNDARTALLVDLLEVITPDPGDTEAAQHLAAEHPTALADLLSLVRVVSLQVERAVILDLAGVLASAGQEAGRRFPALRGPATLGDNERLIDQAEPLGVLAVEKCQARVTDEGRVDLFAREGGDGQRLVHAELPATLARGIALALKRNFQAAGALSGLIDHTIKEEGDLHVGAMARTDEHAAPPPGTRVLSAAETAAHLTPNRLDAPAEPPATSDAPAELPAEPAAADAPAEPPATSDAPAEEPHATKDHGHRGHGHGAKDHGKDKGHGHGHRAKKG